MLLHQSAQPTQPQLFSMSVCRLSLPITSQVSADTVQAAAVPQLYNTEKAPVLTIRSHCDMLLMSQ